MRADELLVRRGLAESRTRARGLIEAGLVTVDGRPVVKAAQKLGEDAALDVSAPAHPWVSRGGVKLAHALRCFEMSPDGRVCLDIGASTGGFTDVLLTGGASRVYAVDAGHGQLHQKLRADARVVSLERVNARNLGPDDVPEPVAAIVCDVSFIGLRKVLPAAMALSSADAWLVALIKPQFEAGPDRIGKKGLVTDPEVHRLVCEETGAWLSHRPGWTVLGLIDSPITGTDGNREFLVAARRDGS